MTPARALRAALEKVGLPGFLRWDRSGQALLVSDAPRRALPGAAEAVAAKADAATRQEGGLLYIDLPDQVYQNLLALNADPPAVVQDSLFPLRALCYGILTRDTSHIALQAKPDIPLLRAALLAEAQGGAAVRAFAEALRAADAEALRCGDTASVRACAAVLSQWLQNNH